MRYSGPDLAALQTARLLREAIEEISEALETRPELKEIKALVGISLLHRGLIHGLGFEVQPLKQGLFRKMTTSYLRLLLSVLHPEGKRRIGRRTEQLVPMRLIHTRMSLKHHFSRTRPRNKKQQVVGE